MRSWRAALRVGVPPRSRFLLRLAPALPLVVGMAIGLGTIPGTRGLANAQSPAPDPTNTSSISGISGRSFAGIRLPLAAVSGPVEFSAQRIWTWTEPGDLPALGPGVGPVTRMHLKGDVRVVLGTYEFNAKSATVWVQKLPEDAVTPAGTYQVYVYFDRVSTPSADATFAIAADRLPVRGVITTDKISLRGDRVERLRPDEPLIAEGEATLRDQLIAIVSPPRPIPPPASPTPRPRERPPTEVAAGTPATPSMVPPTSPAPDGTPATPPTPPTSPTSPSAVAGVTPGSEPSGRVTALPTLPSLLSEEDMADAIQAVNTLAPDDPEAPTSAGPIAPGKGLITFATGQAGEVTIVRGEEENVVLFSSALIVQYTERATGRSIQISADRGAAFLKPGPLTQLATVDADTVRGIYVEGGVQVIGERPSATGSDRYMFRGPQVYYDFQNDRALTIDAMFWTYDSARSLPLYVRAKALKQESANQWTATSAKAANTAFLDPQLSIGASSITMSRRVTPEGDATYADAKNITGRIGAVPVVWWPRFRGDPSAIPLRDLRMDGGASGTAIKTTWDAYALLGLDRTSGVDAEVQLDYYFDRGPAMGTAIDWDSLSTQGRLDGYFVFADMGEDTLKGGAKKGFDHESRGMLLAEHRWQISDAWSVFLEGTYISDETFIDGYFEGLGETRREFTTSATARRHGPSSLLTIQAKGSLNDFIANEYLSQSQGYAVSKLPEVAYVRVADDPLPVIAPGLLSYHSEYRLGRLGMQFSESTGSDLGYRTVAKSQRAFGFDPGTSFANVLDDQGYTEDSITRFDSRHEIDTRLRVGAVNIQPFVVGRVTMYDDSFDEFSPGNDEETRLWGAVGTRAATSFQRVNNTVDSTMFDLHRIRHIIEPSATIWTSGTNVESFNLPIYDSTVEDLANGTAARVAIDQTWQTQRGGPGRWRTVDVFTLDVDYGVFSDDADRKSPIRRFIDYRPEYSQPGEFFQVDSTWQMTETVGLGGNIIYDLELNQPARTSAGALLQHNPDLSSYIEARYINVEDTTFINMGIILKITQKYTLGVNAAYDTDEADFQNVALIVYREMQSLFLQGNIGYNNITGETSGGLTLYPVGTKGRGLQVRPVGAADIRYLDRKAVVR